jgi:hypothetical protein
MNSPLIPLLPPALQRQLTSQLPASTPADSASTDNSGSDTGPDLPVQIRQADTQARSILQEAARAQTGKNRQIAAKVAESLDQLITTATNRRTSLLTLVLARSNSQNAGKIQVQLPDGCSILPTGTTVNLSTRHGQWLLQLAAASSRQPSSPSGSAADPASATSPNTLAKPSTGPSTVKTAAPAGTSSWLAARLLLAAATASSQTLYARPLYPTSTSGNLTTNLTTNISSNITANKTDAANKTLLPPAAGQNPGVSRPLLVSVLDSLLTLSQQTANNRSGSASPGSASQTNSHRLPTALLQQVAAFVGKLPDSHNLSTPGGVQQAVRNSGLFMESALFSQLPAATASGRIETGSRSILQQANQLFASLRSSSGPSLSESEPATTNSANSRPADPSTTDTKALLIRLLAIAATTDTSRSSSQTIRSDLNLPLTMPQQPEASSQNSLRQLQAALADIELSQHRLASAHQQDHSASSTSTDNSLNCNLLYRHQDQPRAVNLQLQRDDSDSTSDPQHRSHKAAQWRLNLQLDLDGIGSVRIDARIGWPRLAVTFWSQQADCLLQLNQQLPDLRQRLVAAGAEVTDLQARFGQPPASAQPAIQRSLVDLFT